MKRIIRLTESDLTRIVRRVIREQDWSDEEEMEYQEFGKGSPNLRDYNFDPDNMDSFTSDDADRFSADAKRFREKRDSNPRYKELHSKKYKKGPWSAEEEAEYQEFRKGGPNLRDYNFDPDNMDSFTSDDADRFSADAKRFREKRDSNPRYKELHSKKNKSLPNQY